MQKLNIFWHKWFKRYPSKLRGLHYIEVCRFIIVAPTPKTVVNMKSRYWSGYWIMWACCLYMNSALAWLAFCAAFLMPLLGNILIAVYTVKRACAYLDWLASEPLTEMLDATLKDTDRSEAQELLLVSYASAGREILKLQQAGQKGR